MRWVLSISCMLAGHISLTQGQPDLCSAALGLHNDYRAKHGSPSLTCNDQITQVAQAYADYLGGICAMVHSNNGTYGENLYMAGTTGKRKSAEIAVQAAVKSWYDEEQCYDYDDPQPDSCRNCDNCRNKAGFCKMDVGHFTQVVWKSTTQLGVGMATCEVDIWKYTIVVANYYTPGNYEGEYDVNVEKKV